MTAYLGFLAGPPPDQSAWAGFVATEEIGPNGRRTVSTDLSPAKSYSVVMPELEWSRRFLRAAARQKQGALAGGKFRAAPDPATYTEALRSYLRNRPADAEPLREAARRLADTAYRR